MLGKRVREQRLQLGLSQRELAGEEMTRHFISLVEAGRSMPSDRTLRIIAARLGKPLSYFRDAPESDVQALTSAAELLATARRRWEASQFGSALALVQELLQMDLDDGLRAEARLLHLQCLQGLKRYDDALAECEAMYHTFLAQHDRSRLVQLSLRWGAIALTLRELPVARQAYERACQHSRDVKSLASQHIEALTYLGSTYLLLGSLNEAAGTYQTAFALASVQGEVERCGLIAMGLGSARSRLGDADGSLHWTRKAVELLGQVGSPDQVLAVHNLATMLVRRGQVDEALDIFQDCLRIYRERGHFHKQASILEELAALWLQQGDCLQARACCREAIDLLRKSDDGVLRGRIYRLLGEIAQTQGDWEHAFYFFDMSWALLRRLKAGNEAALSQQALDRLRHVEPPEGLLT